MLMLKGHAMTRMRRPRLKARHSVRTQGMQYAGTHLLLEIWGATRLDDPAAIRRLLVRTAKACRATLLRIDQHRFSPYHGISAVAILAESHISIHTWPELRYAAMDVFMCGRLDPAPVLRVVRELLRPRRLKLLEVKRGLRALKP